MSEIELVQSKPTATVSVREAGPGWVIASSATDESVVRIEIGSSKMEVMVEDGPEFVVQLADELRKLASKAYLKGYDHALARRVA